MLIRCRERTGCGATAAGADDKLLIMSTRRDTRKFEQILECSKVALLLHDFPTSKQAEKTDSANASTYSIALTGLATVQEGAEAERCRGIHLAVRSLISIRPYRIPRRSAAMVSTSVAVRPWPVALVAQRTVRIPRRTRSHCANSPLAAARLCAVICRRSSVAHHMHMCRRGRLAQHNPDYAQFIQGDNIAILTVLASGLNAAGSFRTLYRTFLTHTRARTPTSRVRRIDGASASALVGRSDRQTGACRRARRNRARHRPVRMRPNRTPLPRQPRHVLSSGIPSDAVLLRAARCAVFRCIHCCNAPLPHSADPNRARLQREGPGRSAPDWV